MDELLSILRRLVGERAAVYASTPLISTGVIDSFSVAALIADLESAFDTTIDPADIGADNFDTPAQMLQFIRSRR